MYYVCIQKLTIGLFPLHHKLNHISHNHHQWTPVLLFLLLGSLIESIKGFFLISCCKNIASHLRSTKMNILVSVSRGKKRKYFLVWVKIMIWEHMQCGAITFWRLSHRFYENVTETGMHEVRKQTIHCIPASGIYNIAIYVHFIVHFVEKNVEIRGSGSNKSECWVSKVSC